MSQHFARGGQHQRKDGDEAYYRRYGVPVESCCSQRATAGAVGKLSAARVHRRACIKTVHDLRFHRAAQKRRGDTDEPRGGGADSREWK